MGKFASVFTLAIVALLLFGCVSQQSQSAKLPSIPSPPTLVGGDKDAHGCIGSAGYTWCEASQKCYRSWEENCTASAPGGRQCKTVSDCGAGAARCVNGQCTQYDEHGCVSDGGYTWCEALQACIQPWMTNCTASPALDGGDRDAHGCIGSAGYTWCADKQQCIRPWETACNATDRLANAEEHCADANMAQVSVCGDYIKVVSSLMGGGSTFYSDNGTATVCPLVAPNSMSPQCSLLMMGSNCVDQVVDCAKVNLPGAVTDLKDDPSFVGAQLTWSAPDSKAVDYEVFRADKSMETVSPSQDNFPEELQRRFQRQGGDVCLFRARAQRRRGGIPNLQYSICATAEHGNWHVARAD